tara:strand:+ start:286 stop:852 length:567 start_codon:yes stop_codon:yes gene_type:complete
MIKQNVNIVNFNSLYEILEEVKENLSFNITKYENKKDYINQKNNLQELLIIANLNENDFSKKNLLVFNNLPLSLIKIIELININLIKLKFNYQSNIKIQGYELDLNSKFFSKNNITLKLTEKEIEIILYLNDKKKKNVQDLQKNIWGYSSNLETHTVETHIYRLRKKIKDKFKNQRFIMSDIEGYFIE